MSNLIFFIPYICKNQYDNHIPYIPDYIWMVTSDCDMLSPHLLIAFCPIKWSSERWDPGNLRLVLIIYRKKPSDTDFRENTLLCRENYKNISFLFYSWYIGLFTMKKGTEWLVPYYTRGSIQDTFIFEMHYIWFPLRSRFYLNRFVPFFYRLDLQRMVSGPYTSEIGGVMEQIHVWR